jgi:biotin operon repressor
MSFVPSNSRVRSNANTRRRDQNVTAIIGALRNGPMLRADLRNVIDMSESGVNKYILMLRADGVIEVDRFVNATRSSPGHPMFRLVRDTERVDDYLRAVAAGSALREKPKQPNRIHRLDTGSFHPGALSMCIPAPDPVLAHFFGLTQPPASA